MNKYIVMLTVIGCMFWAGSGVMAADGTAQSSGTTIQQATDRELSLEFELLQARIQQWVQATRDAQSRLAEIQAEAKKRAEAKKAVKDKAVEKGTPPKP